MKIVRTGSASWAGDFKNGKGLLSTQSGALDRYPYAVASRFEGQVGSNPEELLGVAHAACFTMSMALKVSEAGLTAEQLATSARVTLTKEADGYAITAVHLSLVARIPGADLAAFEALAAQAKAGCPVSKVLNADITLDTTLNA